MSRSKSEAKTVCAFAIGFQGAAEARISCVMKELGAKLYPVTSLQANALATVLRPRALVTTQCAYAFEGQSFVELAARCGARLLVLDPADDAGTSAAIGSALA